MSNNHKKLMRLIYSFLILCSLISISPFSHAQSVAAPVKAETDLSFETSELIDKLEEFQYDKSNYNQQIESWNALDDQLIVSEKITNSFQNIATAFERKKLLSSWNMKKAIDLKILATPLFEKVESYKEVYVKFLADADALLKQLKEQRTQFREYARELAKDPALAIQSQTFTKEQQEIESLINKIKKKRTGFMVSYQTNNALFGNIKNFKRDIDGEIAYFKDSRFKKTTPTFYDKKFYSSFSANLIPEIKDSWENISSTPDSLYKNRNTYFQLITLFLILAFILLNLSRKLNDELIRKPILLSFILILILASLTIRHPAEIVIISFWGIFVSAVIVLLKSLPGNHPERTDIIFLLILNAILQVIDTIGIPLAVYRSSLLGFALIALIYCSLRRKKYRVDLPYFSLTLQLFAFFFGATALAEVFGYHLMSVWLIQGSIKSAILVFFVLYLRYYLLGTLHAITQLPVSQNIKFVQDYRYLIIKNVKALFYFITTLLVVFGLATIWGFYETYGESAEKILALGFHIRSHVFTISMFIQGITLFLVVKFLAFVAKQVLETEYYTRNEISPGLGKSINSLIEYFAWTVGFFFIFSSLGFELRQLALIAGALSVGIGFGLQNIINNFVSGIMLLFERPIKIGDILEINNDWGTVEKVGLRSTVIRTNSKTQIVIPNSELITQKIVNLTLSDLDFRIQVPVSVAYGSDTEFVRNLLIEIGTHADKVAQTPAPTVYFREFGESGLNFWLLVWTHDVVNRNEILSEILFEVHRKFRENKIEMPFPQRDLHLRSIDSDVLEQFNKKQP